MKIILKGFGSIGRRHASNLLGLGFGNLSVISTKNGLGEGFDHLRSFASLEEALTYGPYTHGFICSPTAYHLADLKSFVAAGIKNIYLEKPISHNWQDCEELFNEVSRLGINVVVGFDLHFDPGLLKAKEILDGGVLGTIYSANAFVGQYLPDWRPYEDHREGMSAKLSQGGGVMLDLIHEFDYLRWLLGTSSHIAAFYQNNPQLQIQTEDLADVLVRFDSGATASVHLDYHQRKLLRFCVFTGEKGTLKWDLAQRSLTLTNGSGAVETFDFSAFERNDRYLQIVNSFMTDPEDPRLTGFRDGLQSLKMVLCAKESSEKKSMIQVNSL